MCHYWTTWVHSRFLVKFVLLGLKFFCAVFCRSLFDLLNFAFAHCIVCPSLNHEFWLPLWYLQSFRGRLHLALYFKRLDENLRHKQALILNTYVDKKYIYIYLKSWFITMTKLLILVRFSRSVKGPIFFFKASISFWFL